MKQRAVLLLIIWSIPLLASGSVFSSSMAAEGSIYDTTPTEVLSDPLVLSLADCVQAALENNFDIAVARYDPLQAETLLTVEEAVFDPSLTGRATSSDTEVRRIFTAFGGGLSSFMVLVIFLPFITTPLKYISQPQALDHWHRHLARCASKPH